MNEAITVAQDVIKRIYGLDPAMLISVFSIVLGYILKALPGFPNDKIPYLCMGLPVLLYPCLVFTGFEIKKVTSDLLMAVIFSGLAWLFHRSVLRRYLDPKLFPPDTDPKVGPDGGN